jgi:hypothetical protein
MISIRKIVCLKGEDSSCKKTSVAAEVINASSIPKGTVGVGKNG